MSKQSRAAGRLRGFADNSATDTITLTKTDALAIADLLAPPNGDSPVTAAEISHVRQLLFDQGAQLLACGIALQTLRVHGLGPIEMRESEAIKTYLRAWIDDGKFQALAWPENLPGYEKWLLDLGFAKVNGRIGLPGVATDRRPPFAPPVQA